MIIRVTVKVSQLLLLLILSSFLTRVVSATAELLVTHSFSTILFRQILIITTNISYTVSQKNIPVMFDNYFGKCGPIFQILSLIRKKIIYVHIEISASPAICCYATLWNLEIQKMLLILTVSSTNCWHVSQDTLNIWFNI